MTDQSSNDLFHASSFMQGANAQYLEQMYARYAKDPGAVDESWQEFFRALGDDEISVKKEASGPSWARRDWPPMPGDEFPNPQSESVRLWLTIARNCLGHSLKASKPRPDESSVMVEPVHFLDWIEQKELTSVPEGLKTALDSRRVAVGSTRRKPADGQRHAERCQALAALLWEREGPEIKLKQMAERQELCRIGCEGKHYSTDTVKTWIREGAPAEARKPGAPGNPRGESSE